jgi:hypothetical protein
MKRLLVVAAALLLVAGCSGSSKFVYKPAVPRSGGNPIPLRLAVLPFVDGTGDYTVRGSALTPENCTYNLAKAGIWGRIDALTPEQWAKAFADELAASGAWRSVRFVYGSAELADEDYLVEGTLKCADSAHLHLKGQNRFALALRARPKAGRSPAWEKEVSKSWVIPSTIFDGCGMDEQCRADRAHADVNRAMQALFAEAGDDLAVTLSALAGNRAPEGAPTPAGPSGPAGRESVDATIEGILKAK